jgi:hypothetical protein
MQKALAYRNRRYLDIDFFYRDREYRYFEEAKKNGWLKTVLKDTNGDPFSAIHNRLNVIHFQVNVDFRTHEPRSTSIYGDHRIRIPVDYIFAICPRLYFSDFYCLSSSSHYITLVATKPNSDADLFCQRHLVELDIEDNDFLVWSRGQCSVLSNGVWTELLVTEDLDMDEMQYEWGVCVEEVTWKGNNKGGPKRKNPHCSVCNI